MNDSDLDALGTLAAAVIGEAPDRLPFPRPVPASVRATGATTVAVVPDDTTATLSAQNLSGRLLRAGDRVMVEYAPPHGLVDVGFCDREAPRIGGTWRRVANQVIATTAVTNVSWDTEDYDSDGHLPPSATTGTTFTTQIAGCYAANAFLYLSVGGASGTRQFSQLLLNAVEIVRVAPSNAPAADTGFMCNGFSARNLAVGDTLVWTVFQETGGNSNLTGRLEVIRLGPTTNGVT